MKTFVGVAAILCLAAIASGQFRLPGFGGSSRRPPSRGLFQAGGGGGGGGCTPTPNHQFGGKSYWVGWRTCGTEYRGDQVTHYLKIKIKLMLSLHKYMQPPDKPNLRLQCEVVIS